LNKIEISEDISFLLYILPIVLSGVYALFLWILKGITFYLPSEVYLAVTENFIIFGAGVLAVCLAVVIEVSLNPSDLKMKKIEENTSRMRYLAWVYFMLSLFFAWSATGYSFDLIGTFDIYVKGRYALLYPIFLFGLSFALTPSIKDFIKVPKLIFEVMPFALIITSPLLLYALWRLHLPTLVILSIPLLFFISGVTLFLYSIRKKGVGILDTEEI